jgi:hypothetical protein
MKIRHNTLNYYAVELLWNIFQKGSNSGKCGRGEPAAHAQVTIDRGTRTMKVYQVSYDLRKQRNYDALYKRIKDYGSYCHPLESSWVIATSETASQVRDYLAQAMDQDDGLLVTRLQGEAAWRNIDDKISNWLKQQLGTCTV